MLQILRFCFPVLALFCGLNVALADIILPDLFSDHMILQQKTKVEIWGWATPGEPISIKSDFFNKTIQVVTDSGGVWKANMRTPAAGGPFSITVSGYSRKIIKDIYFGEVWVASGQSNMEMFIDSISGEYSGIQDYRAEIEKANYPTIREFEVKNTYSKEPETNCFGTWKIATQKNAGNLSATAFFFARRLQETLNVPVGIINATWGGTPIQAWMSKNYLKPFDEYASLVAKINKEESKVNQNYPCALYNGMIAPVIPFTIKGAIWYQGESNIRNPDQYDELMGNLIKGWRDKWDQGKFPFLYVQIAPYDYLSRSWFEGDQYSLGRLIDAQTKVLDLKNTGMIHTSDIGNKTDIHPKNKQEVGRRLALLALDDVYREKIEVINGPVLKKAKIKDQQVLVRFDQTGSGLVVKGKELAGFELAGPDGKFYDADARIDGKDVVVTAEEVPNPVAVRFAYKNTSEVNLFNQEGFPARPFAVDP